MQNLLIMMPYLVIALISIPMLLLIWQSHKSQVNLILSLLATERQRNQLLTNQLLSKDIPTLAGLNSLTGLTSDEDEEYVPADDYARQQYLLKNSQFKVEDVDPDLASKGWDDSIIHEEFNDGNSRPVVLG